MTAGARVASDYARAAIDRTQGRSVVMSTTGIVATEHPLASQAGAALLARGAHAVDAAIAANAVMGVVAPMMNGVGGDLFAIVVEGGSGRIHGVNASGWAPSRATIQGLKARGSRRCRRAASTGDRSRRSRGVGTAPDAVWPCASRHRACASHQPCRDGLPGIRTDGRRMEQRRAIAQTEPEATRIFLGGAGSARGRGVQEP